MCVQIQPPNVVIQVGPSGVAVFPTVGVTLSQLVFWTNKDTKPHFPVPVTPADAFQLPGPIAPGTTSNTQAPGISFTTLAQGEVHTITYMCSCKNHQREIGILEIVNDFFAPNEQISITRNGNVLPPTALITGGKPNYTFQVAYSELPAGVQVTDGGVNGPQVTGSTTLPGTYLLRMTIQDALSNVLTDTFQITIN